MLGLDTWRIHHHLILQVGWETNGAIFKEGGNNLCHRKLRENTLVETLVWWAFSFTALWHTRDGNKRISLHKNNVWRHQDLTWVHTTPKLPISRDDGQLWKRWQNVWCNLLHQTEVTYTVYRTMSYRLSCLPLHHCTEYWRYIPVILRPDFYTPVILFTSSVRFANPTYDVYDCTYVRR